MADPESARGGGVSHILAEKRGVSFTLFQKMHENAIFSPKRGGRMPGTPYAGSATDSDLGVTKQNPRFRLFRPSSNCLCKII